jgi:hypothetical protein
MQQECGRFLDPTIRATGALEARFALGPTARV